MTQTVDQASFGETAKGLARNPLGVIALFIVLVYSVAAIVIGFAKPDFYSSPNHPAVLFVVFFPVIVLAAFVYLVARHHGKLYAPGDYAGSDFIHTLPSAPKAIQLGTEGIATSEVAAREVPAEATAALDARYREVVDAGFCLLHSAEVLRPRTKPYNGLYRARIWIEAIERQPLGTIESVTYRVWNDFPQPVMTTEDRQSSFDLWVNVYGEFPVLALVKLKSGETIELQRFIDLPGRPPD